MSGIFLAAAIGASGLTVTLSPANVSRSGGGSAPAMTALPANGSGPYTYTWTVAVPDPNYTLTINSPAAQTTDFNFAPLEPGGVATATVRCTVTDTSNGATASATGRVTAVDNRARNDNGGQGQIP